LVSPIRATSAASCAQRRGRFPRHCGRRLARDSLPSAHPKWYNSPSALHAACSRHALGAGEPGGQRRKAAAQVLPQAQEALLTAVSLVGDLGRRRVAQPIALAGCKPGALPSQDHSARWRCRRPSGSPIALSATSWWHTLPAPRPCVCALIRAGC
jgi:hypothetical protein